MRTHIIRHAVRTKALALGIALALPFAFVAPNAGATAVIAATEPTQILNHIELIAQYEKQLQQAITQARMYVALAQQLKSMPGNAANSLRSAKDSLSNTGGANLQAAQNMLNALEQSQASIGTIGSEAQNAYQTLNILKAQGHDMTISQYELGMAALAQKHANTYGVRLKNYEQALQNQKQASAEMSAISQSAPQITSEVGGLQAVIHTNAILGQQLANINNTLANASVVSTQQAADAAQAQADRRTKAAQSACSAAVLGAVLGAVSAQQKATECSHLSAPSSAGIQPNG